MTVDRKLNLAAGEVRRFSETVVIPTLDSPRLRAILSTGKPPKSVVRPAGIAAATAVLVLVIVGAAALLRGNEPQEIADTPPTVPSVVVPTETTASPTRETTVSSENTLPPTPTTAPLVPIPAELQMSWQRIDGQAALENSWLTTVVEGGPGLVAGGYVKDGPTDDLAMNAAIWVSTDGYQWERVDDPDVFGISGDGLIADVLMTDDGFVALGYEGSDRVIWRSSNGQEWELLPIEEWPYQSMSGPTSGNRYWISVDGIEWYESRPIGSGDLSVYDVVAGGPAFVAVGGEVISQDPFQRRSVIWTSPDGTEWSRLPDEEVGDFDVFVEVAVGPGGSPMLAFGASTLFSEDGLEWYEVAASGPTPFESRNRAVWTDRGVVISGLTFRGDSAEVWVSDNGGATLHAIESAAFKGTEASISDIAVFSGDIVAVGGDKGNWIGWHWGPTPITEPGRDGGVWIGSWTNG